ncbi:hypothetical protein ACI6PO_21280 [Agrobacterium tumefaciens]
MRTGCPVQPALKERAIKPSPSTERESAPATELGTHNALTNEDWWEAPGLVATYSDEFFKRADITMRHDGGGRFKADVSGETQFGTSFDISFDAPLTVQLNACRNSATADELVQWFDRFLRQDDFVFSQEKRGEDLYLQGAVR